MKTGIAELLGMKHPIVQSPMTGVSFPPLVSVVCNVGGLDILATGGGGQMNPDELRKMTKQTRGLSDNPFGVNFVAFSLTGDEARDAETRETKVKILAPH